MTKSRSRPAIRYSVHPSVPYARRILERLPETTQRSQAEWLGLLAACPFDTLSDRRKWLKTEYDLGGTTGNLLAELSFDGEAFTDETYLQQAEVYVDSLYSGKREPLRAIHDELMRRFLKLGADIRISPCKSMVPIYRHHVFAQVKPTTQTRLDLGLALRDAPRRAWQGLKETGGLANKDRITHQVGLEHVEDVDDRVQSWIELAYSLDPADAAGD